MADNNRSGDQPGLENRLRRATQGSHGILVRVEQVSSLPLEEFCHMVKRRVGRRILPAQENAILSRG